MRRNSAKILANGRAGNWLGANFWSRTDGPLMWRNYDGQTVGGEAWFASEMVRRFGAHPAVCGLLADIVGVESADAALQICANFYADEPVSPRSAAVLRDLLG